MFWLACRCIFRGFGGHGGMSERSQTSSCRTAVELVGDRAGTCRNVENATRHTHPLTPSEWSLFEFVERSSLSSELYPSKVYLHPPSRRKDNISLRRQDCVCTLSDVISRFAFSFSPSCPPSTSATPRRHLCLLLLVVLLT